MLCACRQVKRQFLYAYIFFILVFEYIPRRPPLSPMPQVLVLITLFHHIVENVLPVNKEYDFEQRGIFIVLHTGQGTYVYTASSEGQHCLKDLIRLHGSLTVYM